MSYQSDFRQALYERHKYWGVYSDQQANKLADMGLAQAQVESADFTSSAFIKVGNCIGYGKSSDSQYQNGMNLPTLDDVGNLGGYNSVKDCAYELADWIHRHDWQTFNQVNTVYDYANAMKKNGYMSETAQSYGDNMAAYYYPNSFVLFNAGLVLNKTMVYVVLGVGVAGSILFWYLFKNKKL